MQITLIICNFCKESKESYYTLADQTVHICYDCSKRVSYDGTQEEMKTSDKVLREIGRSYILRIQKIWDKV